MVPPSPSLLILGTTYTITSLALTSAFVIIFYLYSKTTTAPTSPHTHDPRSTRYKKLRYANFPPPFPNGWYHVCNLADIKHGKVHSISALGMDIVAFRGKVSKAVTLMKAHCPHLGAHLGVGGSVVGDNIKCPFHGWEMDGSGAAVTIPYSKMKSVPEKCKTDVYPNAVKGEMVWMWFDAEGRPPMWELKCHDDVVAKGMTLRVVKQNTFYQHIAEMCENSADPYHFQTLHGPLPVPLLNKLVKCNHAITQKYPEEGAAEIHCCHFTEQMDDLNIGPLLGLTLSFRNHLPFAARILDSILTKVTFEGPGNISFSISTPLGEMRMFMTNLPLEPYKQHVENHWYAPWYLPTFVVYIFATLSAHALEQDRGVWESKVYKGKMNLVTGDGPFVAFRRYWKGLYSESSERVGKDGLEW
jgi:cholesterol 7-dehydrogenase